MITGHWFYLNLAIEPAPAADLYLMPVPAIISAALITFAKPVDLLYTYHRQAGKEQGWNTHI